MPQWTKDANGNWANQPEAAPPKQDQSAYGNYTAASPADGNANEIDEASYDGTYTTNATMEEIYNARENTVEKEKTRRSRVSPYKSGGNPSAYHPEEEDDRSMSSMSMLFRNARGDRYNEVEEEDPEDAHNNYASHYQPDDDATIDSLSDVFSKKKTETVATKTYLEPPKPASTASTAISSLTNPDSFRKPASTISDNAVLLGPASDSDTDGDGEDDDDTLADIIGGASNLHDQAVDDKIASILPDEEAPEVPREEVVPTPVAPAPKPKFKMVQYDTKVVINKHDADPEMSVNTTDSPSKTTCASTLTPQSKMDETEVASQSSSSGSSTKRKKKAKKGSACTNKRLFCWLLGIIVLVALVMVLFFQLYYRLRGKNNSKKNNTKDSEDSTNLRVPTMSRAPKPTFSPTLKGETHPPTVSPFPTYSPTIVTETPTNKPTENYIDPLMEFLQDNQVYFEKDPFSPDFMAVQWLAAEAQYGGGEDGVSSAYGNGLELNTKLIQRFALLTLDYALHKDANATQALSSQAAGASQPGSSNVALKQNRNKLATTALQYAASDFETFQKIENIGVRGSDECLWEGVTCASVGSNAGMVEAIDFSHSGLSGTIPPEIKLLKNLKKLNLAGNDLHGPIPESIYNIREMQQLYLYQNQLTGSISPNINNWWNITHLHLSHNKLTGNIPITIMSGQQIRPIKYLNLYSNQLTGTIPKSLRFRKMLYMDLGRNQLTGTLPEDIGSRFVELRFLYVDHNKLTGTIPYTYPTVGNGRVEVMAFNNNQLTGYAPGDFQFNKLLQFNIHNNQFSGVDYGACKQSVFSDNEMVEYKADCDICNCKPFCERFCKPETEAPTDKWWL